jgi:uncharacterized membrane protein YqjE
METDKLLKHVIDVKLECPICYDFKTLEYKCEACGWVSCVECSNRWRGISNTCPQCRIELEELEVEEQKCSLCRFAMKVGAIIFFLYMCLVFAIINSVFSCLDDNIWCILTSILIYVLIVYFAVLILKKLLE